MPDDVTPDESLPAHNPYDALVGSEPEASDKTAALQASMYAAGDQEPEAAIRTRILSRRSGLPESVVARNLDEVKRRADLGLDYQGIVDQTPRSAAYLSDPTNAASSKDDIAGVTGLENAVQDHGWLSSLSNSLVSSAAGFDQKVARIPGLVYNLGAIPQNILAEIPGLEGMRVSAPDFLMNNAFTRAQEQAKQAYAVPEQFKSLSGELAKGNYGMATRVATNGLVQMLPDLMLAGLASPLGMVAETGTFGTLAASEKNAKNQESGVDPLLATGNALAHGATTAAMGSLMFGPLKEWGNALAGSVGKTSALAIARDAFKTILASAGGGALGGAASEVANSWADASMGDEDAWNGILHKGLDASLMGLVQGGTFAAASVGFPSLKAAHQASRDANFWNSVGTLAENSKLRAADPVQYQALLDHQLHGSDVETAYVPVQALENYFQSKGIEPAHALREMHPEVLAAYEAAKSEGQEEVSIPTSVLVNSLAGTKHYQGLAGDIKFSPDGQTTNQRVDSQKQMQEEADRAVEQHDAALSNIKDAVKDQLVGAGRPEAEAEQHAEYSRRLIDGLARAGQVSPEDIVRQFPWVVEGPDGIKRGVESVLAEEQGSQQATRSEQDYLQKAAGGENGVDIVPTGDTVESSKPLPSPDELTQLRAERDQLHAALGKEKVLRRTSELTGLPNKIAFEEESASRPYPHVVAADLDNFKAYNTLLGHEAVDSQVLPVLGNILAKAGKDLGLDIFHRSGDELMAAPQDRTESKEVTAQKMDEVMRRMSNIIMDVTGTEESTGKPVNYRINGVHATYGMGEGGADGKENYKIADAAAGNRKSERRAAGDLEDLRSTGGVPRSFERLADGSFAAPEGRDGEVLQPGGRTGADLAEQTLPEEYKQGPTEADILHQSAPTYYSKLSRLIDEKMPSSAPTDMVRGITKDISPEEKKWMGLDEFLKGKEKVSKPELQDFLRANMLDIKEVVKGGEEGSAESAARHEAEVDRRVGQRINDIVEQRIENGEGYERQDPEERDGAWHVGDEAFDSEEEAQAVSDKLYDRARDEMYEDAANEVDRDEIETELANDYDAEEEPSNTKYQDYTLPGGENYREVLLTLPGSVDDSAQKPLAWIEYRDKMVSDGLTSYEANEVRRYLLGAPSEGIDQESVGRARDKMGKQFFREYEDVLRHRPIKKETFKSSHFDEKNILAHVRLDDRVDADGKKVLFVEEIQSDWHQKGRKEGYKSDGNDYAEKKSKADDLRQGATDALRGIDNLGYSTPLDAMRGIIQEGENWSKAWGVTESSPEYKAVESWRIAVEEVGASKRDSENAVPGAPFKKTWHEFALKRILREAAEKGYDRVAWTTGTQQNARYDLSKHVDSISLFRFGKNTSVEVNAVDKNGHPVNMGRLKEENLASELPDMIGKEAAEKLLAQEWQVSESTGKDTSIKKLQGLDLELGGSGMKGFYDDILVKSANKLVKKFGASVGETEFGGGESLAFDSAAKAEKWLYEKGDRKTQSILKNGDKFYIFDDKTGDTVSSSVGVTVHSIDMTPGLVHAAMNEGFSLFQNKPEGDHRASISFSAGESPEERFRALVKFTPGADASSWVHEFGGHYAMKVMESLAKLPDAKPELIDDLAKLREYAGAEPGMPLTEAQHERVAEAAEAYVMEGKAPSVELQGAFYRLKFWMVAVYKKLAMSGVKLTDDVRGVFDRLLASEDQVQQARQQQGADPMPGFGDKKYLESIEAAKRSAENLLNARLQAQFSREQKKEWKAERAKVEENIALELRQQPEYQALDRLLGGKGLDGEKLPAGTPDVKLDREAVIGEFGGYEGLGRLPKRITQVEGGLHPDVAAEMFGFKDGKDMLDRLAATKPFKEALKEQTDARMHETHGDMMTDGTLPAEALAAIHNEKQDEVYKMEMKFLREKGLNGLVRKAAAPVISTPDLKDQADQAIGLKRVRDINPDAYRKTEAKLAREAVDLALKGDFKGAEKAKAKQRLNSALFRSASDAKEAADKGVDYMKKFDKPSVREKLDLEHREQIDSLLDRYDIRKSTSGAEIDRRKQSLSDFVEKLSSQGYEPQIPEKFLDEMQRQHYKDMPFAEFSALVDAIRSIDKTGRLSKKVMDLGKAKDLQELADEAAATAGQLKQTKADTNRGLTRMESKWVSTKAAGRSMQAALLKMEQMFDWLDDRDTNGVFNRVVFRRISAAGIKEYELQAKMKDAHDELLSKHLEDVTKDGGKIYTADGLKDRLTGENQKFTKKEMLALAGNVGNESNMAKLVAGEGWSDSAVWDFLHKNMSKADWDFVAGYAKTFESIWPEKVAMSQRLGNSKPDKVEPRPFSTPHGDYAGWYWPMVYDPARSQDVAERGAKKADALFENIYSRANTDTGRMNTRIEGYARPLLLSIDAIPRIMSDEIHDVAYREAILDADKFLSHSDVRNAIVSALSQEHYDQLRPWLQSIANDRKVDMQSLKWFDQLAHGVRTRATIVGLGYRLTTMLVHGSSAGIESVAELGPKWFGKGLADFVKPNQWAANRDFIFERSGEMKNRMNEVDRDIREHLREIDQRLMDPAASAISRGSDLIKAHAYQGIAMLDMATALPTWMGAYQKAMSPESDGGLAMKEEDAVYFADKTVRNAHGGTGIKDLAAVQRGPEFFKLFTMFYTFWNHNVNRLMDTARMAGDKRTWRDSELASQVIMRTLIYTLGVQTMHSILHPPKDDEESSWLKWAGKEIGMSAFAGVPILRDVAAHYITGKDYSATPAAGIVDAIGNSGEDAMNALTGGDVSDKWLKHAITTAGYVFSLPTGQPASTIQFLADVQSGKQDPIGAKDWWNGVLHGNTNSH